jgi:riboflavin kinase/FMN adenylyltransferase
MRVDFALGNDGTPAVLAEIGTRLGYRVETISRLWVDGEEVSSNAIGRRLAEGNVARAGQLLGRPPAASGPVVEGAKRGRLIGVPTANLAPPGDLLLPANGVYAAVATCPELPRPYPAMVNIGTRPTFDNGARTVEAHLLDFDGDLYGMLLTLHFIDWLRAEQRFDGVPALVAQLQRDRAATAERITERAAREGSGCGQGSSRSAVAASAYPIPTTHCPLRCETISGAQSWEG